MDKNWSIVYTVGFVLMQIILARKRNSDHYPFLFLFLFTISELTKHDIVLTHRKGSELPLFQFSWGQNVLPSQKKSLFASMIVD